MTVTLKTQTYKAIASQSSIRKHRVQFHVFFNMCKAMLFGFIRTVQIPDILAPSDILGRLHQIMIQ